MKEIEEEIKRIKEDRERAIRETEAEREEFSDNQETQKKLDARMENLNKIYDTNLNLLESITRKMKRRKLVDLNEKKASEKLENAKEEQRVELEKLEKAKEENKNDPKILAEIEEEIAAKNKEFEKEIKELTSNLKFIKETKKLLKENDIDLDFDKEEEKEEKEEEIKQEESEKEKLEQEEPEKEESEKETPEQEEPQQEEPEKETSEQEDIEQEESEQDESTRTNGNSFVQAGPTRIVNPGMGYNYNQVQGGAQYQNVVQQPQQEQQSEPQVQEASKEPEKNNEEQQLTDEELMDKIFMDYQEGKINLYDNYDEILKGCKLYNNIYKDDRNASNKKKLFIDMFKEDLLKMNDLDNNEINDIMDVLHIEEFNNFSRKSKNVDKTINSFEPKDIKHIEDLLRAYDDFNSRDDLSDAETAQMNAIHKILPSIRAIAAYSTVKNKMPVGIFARIKNHFSKTKALPAADFNTIVDLARNDNIYSSNSEMKKSVEDTVKMQDINRDAPNYDEISEHVSYRNDGKNEEPSFNDELKGSVQEDLENQPNYDEIMDYLDDKDKKDLEER